LIKQVFIAIRPAQWIKNLFHSEFFIDTFYGFLIFCTALVALFPGFCKRRHELLLQENAAENSRKVLSNYSPCFLDQMIAVVMASTVMPYARYTVSEAKKGLEKFRRLGGDGFLRSIEGGINFVSRKNLSPVMNFFSLK